MSIYQIQATPRKTAPARASWLLYSTGVGLPFVLSRLKGYGITRTRIRRVSEWPGNPAWETAKMTELIEIIPQP